VEKFERSWQIMRASWDVLRQDKEILVFPAISGIALILIMASFAVPFSPWAASTRSSGLPATTERWETWWFSSAFYFINYFVVIFFNTAIVACATIRMRAATPRWRRLQASGERVFEIAGWALVDRPASA